MYTDFTCNFHLSCGANNVNNLHLNKGCHLQISRQLERGNTKINLYFKAAAATLKLPRFAPRSENRCFFLLLIYKQEKHLNGHLIGRLLRSKNLRS